MDKTPDRPAIVIREEQPAETAAIREVHMEAFGRDAEGRLVDQLRDGALIVSSVVAVVDEQIVGSALFSRLAIKTPTQALEAVSLAPVAVKPSHQRAGIGSRMITFGLRLCEERGYIAAFLLGDPHYYSRFGFSHDLAITVRSPYSNAGAAWMALRLRRSADFGSGAEAEYPAAFRIVD